MTPGATLECLQKFHQGKTALRRRHEDMARVAGQYDLNNTFQYIIAREDQHLGWLADAIVAAGGAPLPAGPDEPAPRGADGGEIVRAAGDEADRLEEFARLWSRRIEPMTHARHRLLLGLILGETLEHARLFRQAAGGSLDLLGRRTGGERLPGSVLPARWTE